MAQASQQPNPAPRALAPAAHREGTHARLDARKGDIECMVGLPSGRYTAPAAPLWLGVAAILTVAFAMVLVLVAPRSYLLELMNRCWTNWAVVFFSWWCLGILAAKWMKTSVQMRALRAVEIVPRRGDFVLSPGTAGEVLRRIKAVADRPKDFILFRRIEMALSNLGNIGEVRDVGAVLESQADSDASAVDSSYTVIRSLIWTIPILGFIGTVVGLSQAIGSFTDVLNLAGGDSASIKSKLGPVVGGLATAFETTLVALLAAVCIQLLSTWVYKREESLLDAITDFTNEHILSRLKLTDWQ
ncbi:MAG: MotA/TolQ/ExbB proton channel family protein [Planctomycetota bacterium]